MLKYILIFLALILIINYFEVFLVILIILSIIGGIVWYIDYKTTERYLSMIDKYGVISLSSSDIPENIRKKLSDSYRTILLPSDHLMSAAFYEKLLNRVNSQNFVTQKEFPEVCRQCTVNFNRQYGSLVSNYILKQGNWIC